MRVRSNEPVMLAVRTGYESYANSDQLASHAWKFSVSDDGIAIISIVGSQHEELNYWDNESYLSLRSIIEQCINHDGVKGIIFSVNSPGGEVHGCMETARYIREMAQIKPIYAHTEGLCCSAAYLLASSATKLFATAQSEIGSCGVICSFVDDSEAMKMNGFKRFILTSKHAKGKNVDYTTDEGKKILQARIDEFEDMYFETVASNRGIKKEDVIENFGGGGDFLASEALERGMIDDVADFATAYAEMVNMLSEESEDDIDGGMDMNVTEMSADERKKLFAELMDNDPELRASNNREILEAETARVSGLNALKADGTEEIIANAIKDGSMTAENPALLKQCFEALNAKHVAEHAELEELRAYKAQMNPVEARAEATQEVETPAREEDLTDDEKIDKDAAAALAALNM